MIAAKQAEERRMSEFERWVQNNLTLTTSYRVLVQELVNKKERRVVLQSELDILFKAEFDDSEIEVIRSHPDPYSFFNFSSGIWSSALFPRPSFASYDRYKNTPARDFKLLILDEIEQQIESMEDDLKELRGKETKLKQVNEEYQRVISDISNELSEIDAEIQVLEQSIADFDINQVNIKWFNNGSSSGYYSISKGLWERYYCLLQGKPIFETDEWGINYFAYDVEDCMQLAKRIEPIIATPIHMQLGNKQWTVYSRIDGKKYQHKSEDFAVAVGIMLIKLLDNNWDAILARIESYFSQLNTEDED